MFSYHAVDLCFRVTVTYILVRRLHVDCDATVNQNLTWVLSNTSVGNLSEEILLGKTVNKGTFWSCNV